MERKIIKKGDWIFQDLPETIDLSPFEEPIEVSVGRFPIGGWEVKCRTKINNRWQTETEYLEHNRIFGHRGDLDRKQLKREFLQSIVDMEEKRLWVFKANHGMLDHAGARIRFKA